MNEVEVLKADHLICFVLLRSVCVEQWEYVGVCFYP